MTKQEEAKMILESLEEYIQVNAAFEEFYLKGIMNGLREIEKKKNETGK